MSAASLVLVATGRGDTSARVATQDAGSWLQTGLEGGLRIVQAGRGAVGRTLVVLVLT